MWQNQEEMRNELNGFLNAKVLPIEKTQPAVPMNSLRVDQQITNLTIKHFYISMLSFAIKLSPSTPALNEYAPGYIS